jgi:hypothetical protein
VEGRAGALSGDAVAEVSGCCGGRVSGITTGPVRRGASGAGVSRREAVGGRPVKTGPEAGAMTRPVAAGSLGRSGAGVNRREAVGGRNAPVWGFAEGGVPESAGCCVRLRGMKTGDDFRASVGTVDAAESAGGRVKPVGSGLAAAGDALGSGGGTPAGADVPGIARASLPEGGSGAVDGRDEASSWEADGLSKPPEAGRVSGGSGRVGGRGGAGAVVRRNWAVDGRV